MRLYTFQPLWIVDTLKTTGYWRPEGTRQRLLATLDTPDEPCPFMVSYDWLGTYMLEQGRVPLRPVKDVMDLVWLWANRPELHTDGGSSFYAEPHALLELEIPEERVLLTDFDIWHHPLNMWPVAPYAEVDAFQDKAPWEHRYTDPALLAELKATWPRVCDLAYCATIKEGFDPLAVQATVFDISLKDVVRIEYPPRPFPEADDEQE